MSSLSAQSLPGLPEICAGDDLAESIVRALHAEAPLAAPLHDGQVVAIAHKAVSKAEGAVIDLATVTPGERARELAAEQGKDARAVQVVLDQSAEIIRAANGVLICRTHHGFVCANAGVDASNAAAEAGAVADAGAEAGAVAAAGETLIVLPRDPDASARALRARLRELTGASPAVLITDSFGRAWRNGQCDVALGCAGIAPLEDWRGRTDSVGLELRATWIAVADAAASLADLARAKDSREPVVLIDGLERFVTAEDGPGAAALLRPLEEDLFR
jgi:coenzyme F420-0:L-glutamate ligase / coenzyme F420-1:gamma-L-glutamate ligase